MKIAEETLKEVLECHKIYQTFLTCHPEWLMKKTIEAIKQAQKETINETVRRCKAEAYAEESYPECSWEVNMDTFADIETELKKELGL